jgi:hypothetical protein
VTKPAKIREGVPMVKVGEYNDRVPIEGVTQIRNDASVFSDPRESTSWRERASGNLQDAGNDGVHHG